MIRKTPKIDLKKNELAIFIIDCISIKRVFVNLNLKE